MASKLNNSGYSRHAIRGTSWNFLSFFSGKLLSFVSTVVLARLLTKDDFGLVAYAVTFISFLEVANSFGIDLSLIYHKESEKYSYTSFWLTSGICILLYVMTFVSAPFVGSFFNDLRVVPVVRVLGLIFPLQALGATHSILLQKKMEFGLKFIPDKAKSISKLVISVSFAYLGYGPWSLVWGQVGGTALAVVLLWIIFPWRPKLDIDFGAAKSLMSYGVKIMSVDIVSMFSSNIDYLFVGRYMSSEILGVYTLSFRLPELLIGGIARIVGNVVFPIFTHIRDTTGELSRGFYMTTQYVSLVTVPLGVGLALVARPFTLVIFTEKWIDLIPIMQALSIFAMINTLAYNVGTLFKVIGSPQIITWLELIRLTLLAPFFAWAVISIKSVVLVAWVHAAVALILSLLTIYLAVLRSQITWQGILIALRPSFFAVAPMTMAVLAIIHFTYGLSAWLQLVVTIVPGAEIYIFTLWVVDRELVLDGYQKILKAVLR